MAFWDVMQCGLVNRHQSLLGSCSLYFQAKELIYSEDGGSMFPDPLVSICKDSQRQISEDRDLNIHGHETIRSHSLVPVGYTGP
jgi:hypothetical protein